MGRPLSEAPKSPTRAAPAQRPDSRQQPQDSVEIRRRQPSRTGSIAGKAKAFERAGFTPTLASPVATRSKRSEEGALSRA
eukprot:1797603-Pyramimonas_sp.AAC.1